MEGRDFQTTSFSEGDAITGLYFDVNTRKCADICTFMGNSLCSGFSMSQKTRTCFLFHRGFEHRQDVYIKQSYNNAPAIVSANQPPLQFKYGKRPSMSTFLPNYEHRSTAQKANNDDQFYIGPKTTPRNALLMPTKPSMVPSSIKGYTEFSVNCLGSTLSGHKNIEFSDCAKLCDFLNDCEGFSYASLLKDCFLKASRECIHPTGENSPFRFYRKDSKLAKIDEDLYAMIDGLVEEDDIKGRSKAKQLRTEQSPTTTTAEPTTFMEATTVSESTMESLNYIVEKLPPTTTAAGTLYTPLSGNCPSNNIGDLLPLAYPLCAQLCDSHPHCQGFAYSAVGPSCVLKNLPCLEPVVSQYTFYSKSPSSQLQ